VKLNSLSFLPDLNESFSSKQSPNKSAKKKKNKEDNKE
jgi:hypothetical protein